LIAVPCESVGEETEDFGAVPEAIRAFCFPVSRYAAQPATIWCQREALQGPTRDRAAIHGYRLASAAVHTPINTCSRST
jgi:hypothetical protein